MRTLLPATVLTIVAGLTAASAQAAPIVSGDGETWTSALAAVCAQAGGGAPCSGTTIVINRPSVWMDDALTTPLAHWVSYLDTGYFGSVLAPQAGSAPNPTGQTPIIEISESFVGAAGSAVSLRLWADDTLDVYFNGLLVKAASFTQSTCSAEPIGCEPNEYWDLNALATGQLDTIRMVAYQVGSGTTPSDNPFGVLYSGSYTERRDDVPEPATLALLGAGVAVLCVRNARRKSPPSGR